MRLGQPAAAAIGRWLNGAWLSVGHQCVSVYAICQAPLDAVERVVDVADVVDREVERRKRGERDGHPADEAVVSP